MKNFALVGFAFFLALTPALRAAVNSSGTTVTGSGYARSQQDAENRTDLDAQSKCLQTTGLPSAIRTGAFDVSYDRPDGNGILFFSVSAVYSCEALSVGSLDY